MYGTIARVRPKPGRGEDVVRLLAEWSRTRGARLRGRRAHLVLQPTDRPNELISVGVFPDRATYEANSKDPEQHQWYLRMRELLEADPAWEDGQYILAETSASAAADLVAEWFRAFNQHEIDRALSMVAQDCAVRDVPTGQTFAGRDGLRQYWQGWLTTFPDARCEDLRIAAADNGTVSTEFTGTGTHGGPLRAPDGREVPATGRQVRLPFCLVAMVTAGEISEVRYYYDLMALLAQLGAIPAAAAR